MEKIKNELISICNSSLENLQFFLSTLNTSHNKDIKVIKSRYYSFSLYLLEGIYRLDGLTLSVSEKIQRADMQNKLAEAEIYTHIFECCIEYRGYIEVFMTEAEQILSTECDDTLYKIKSRMDILARKIIYLKNNL